MIENKVFTVKWLRKWSYFILVIGVGIVYLSVVDRWQVYAEPLKKVAVWCNRFADSGQFAAVWEQTENSQVSGDSPGSAGDNFARGEGGDGEGGAGNLPESEKLAAEGSMGGLEGYNSGAAEGSVHGGASGSGNGEGNPDTVTGSGNGENSLGTVTGSGNGEGNPGAVDGSGNGEGNPGTVTGSGNGGNNPGAVTGSGNGENNSGTATGSGNTGSSPGGAAGEGNGGNGLGGASGSGNAGNASDENVLLEVQYMTVEDDYFSDALFIGDSRTVGMFEYGGLEEVSTFYASTGLTVYKMFDADIVTVPGERKKITVEEALQQNHFAKIYLMIGINEMGRGNVESFLEKYREVISHLQELQPDAIIYLQAIIKVTAERSAKGDYITNEGIVARNEGIAQIADNEKVFFLDVNPLICDDTGGMIPEYTFDGVHLKAKYIEIWKDYLKTHAISP